MSNTAARVLNNFSTSTARKGITALKRAGVSEFDTAAIRELLRADLLLSCGGGWYIRKK